MQFDDKRPSKKGMPATLEFNVRSYMRRPAPKPVAKFVNGELVEIAPHDLTRFTDALWTLTAELPTRISLRQALFFCVFAMGDADKLEITLGDVRDKPASETDPRPLFGHGIERAYTVFLEPTERDPDNLGWLHQVESGADRRRKYLRLTPKGQAVVQKILESLWKV